MSQNINQIFIANPATTLAATDLFYLGRSPYGAGDDMACLFSTILKYIPSAVTNTITAASANLVANQNFIANRATLVTLTLPATAAVGTIIEVVGQGAGGWLIAQAAGQQIQVGAVASTLGAAGSIASTNRYDTVRLMCVTANTIFQVVSGVTAGYTIV